MTDTTTQDRPQDRTQDRDDEIDLGYLLAVCLDHKYLIAAITLIAVIAGYVYIQLTTPIYQADALLQVESRSGTLGSIDLTPMAQERTTTQSEILRSRMIMTRAAAQAGLDLQVRPVYFPVVGEALVRNGVSRPGFANGSATVWAGENITVADFQVEEGLRGANFTVRVQAGSSYELLGRDGNVLGRGRSGERLILEQPDISLLITEINAPSGAEFIVQKRTEVAMMRNLQSRFNVQARGDTGVLRLTLTGPDRDELVRSLNAISDVYLIQNINRQAAEAESRLEFLEEQAPEVLAALTDAEEALNDYRASQDSVDLSFETQTMLQRLVRIDAELNELQFEETELAQRFTPSHPSYRSLRERRAHLMNEQARLESRVDMLPETQRQVLRLNRDVDVNQRIYMQMLNTQQELRIARAGTIGNVRILDPALAGGMVAPQRNLILGGSFLGGLFLALCLVLLKHMLRRGVESVEQIENTGLQVYATVPLSDEQTKLNRKRAKSSSGRARSVNTVSSGVLAWHQPADLAVEAMRGLRTSLHFAMLEAKNRCLMLTGPGPSVGKSFVSANLAAVCAQAGQRVLLVDGDLRRGHIHHIFDDSGKNGLSDALAGKIELDAAIRSTEQENFFFVPRGTVPPNPSELLMSARFTEFMERVNNEYDLVIIDTPPALAVTDAAVVGKHAGTAMMIVRFQENTPKEIERALQQLDSAGVVVRGAILNAIEKRATAYYGYGYYHYEYKA